MDLKSSPVVWWVPWFADELVQRPGDGDLGLFKVHLTDFFR